MTRRNRTCETLEQVADSLSHFLTDWIIRHLNAARGRPPSAGRSGLSLVFACPYTVCIRHCFLEHSFLTRGNFGGRFVSQRFISERKLSQILDWNSHPVVIVASLKTQGQILVAHLSHHRSYVASTTSGAGAKPLKHYRCVVKVFNP